MTDYIAFDLETTGLSTVNDEIIEIGAWLITDGMPVKKYSTLVKPKGYLSVDIQRLTGITADMLSGALEIEDILPEFLNFVGDLPLLCHGISFDYSLMCNVCRKLGYDFTLNNTRLGIDTLEISKYLYKGVSHKLKDMVVHLDIPMGRSPKFHRAYYDAYMTKLLYDRFLSMSDIDLITTPTVLT